MSRVGVWKGSTGRLCRAVSTITPRVCIRTDRMLLFSMSALAWRHQLTGESRVTEGFRFVKGKTGTWACTTGWMVVTATDVDIAKVNLRLARGWFIFWVCDPSEPLRRRHPKTLGKDSRESGRVCVPYSGRD